MISILDKIKPSSCLRDVMSVVTVATPVMQTVGVTFWRRKKKASLSSQVDKRRLLTSSLRPSIFDG